jgi:uncharacterized protein YdhG (YjbR/CyaY superfamily)
MSKHEIGDVNAYMAKCPREVRSKLKEIRAAIRKIAPDAVERTDYFQMPGYSYEGYDYDGMFVWFSFKAPNLRLHIRPPVIEDHRKEVAGYKITKAIINFPCDKKVPISLVKKLVNASLAVMKKNKPLKKSKRLG